MPKRQRLWYLAVVGSRASIELVVAIIVLCIALVIDIASRVHTFGFSKGTKGLVASFAGKTFVRFLFPSILFG